MTSSINGIGSGLDVNSIVTQLMQIEQQGQKRVIKQRDEAQARIDALNRINTQIGNVSSAATALDQLSAWNTFKTSSSNSDAATATATTNATSGSLTFTVDRLATTAAVRSANTITSLGSVITSGNLLVAKGGQPFGFTALTSDSSLPVGAYTIQVTQASSAAMRTAANALAASTEIITGVNDTLTANVNGSAETFTIAAGTYTRTELASALQTASGGLLTVSVTDTTNKLLLQTANEGSAASIQVTGGTALTDLGLDVDVSATTGGDGAVRIGDTTTTLSDVAKDGTVTLNADSGSITATLSGGLRVGTITAKNVSVGTGSLSAVVNAINQAKVGVSAAAVMVGTNAYRLQIASTAAGSANRLNLDANVFTGIGGLTTMNAGSDAKITIGEGDGAYTVESSTNAVSTLLPGVTINLTAVSTDPVTISIDRDASGLASKVNSLVKAANDAIAAIKKESTYDVGSKSGGPLVGNTLVRSLSSSIMQAISSIVSGNDLRSAGRIGISITRDGAVTFDQSKFASEFETNAEAVADLFVRRGSTSHADIAFSSALPKTRAGTYDVVVSSAPTRASVTGQAVSGGSISSAETIDVKFGTLTATYSAAGGEALDDIAAGLTTAMANAGMSLVASVTDSRLAIQANGYGTAGSFSVRTSATGTHQTGIASTANAWEEHVGVNAAGTIDGKTATGVGNKLSIPVTDTAIPGLVVAVSATSPGSYGTITYTPGIAARLSQLAALTTDPLTGTIPSTLKSGRNQIRRFNADIANWDQRLAERQVRLKLQYANLDSTLGQLRNQGSWISSQLNSLG